MRETNENNLINRIKSFFKKIFFKEKKLELLETQNNIERKPRNLDYIKTDTTISDLKRSLENGYKKISQLSDDEINRLIPIYEEEIRVLEEKLGYNKKSEWLCVTCTG